MTKLFLATPCYGGLCLEKYMSSIIKLQLLLIKEGSFAANIVKSDLRYTIFEAFEKEGIEIPFPQRTLTFANSPTTLK